MEVEGKWTFVMKWYSLFSAAEIQTYLSLKKVTQKLFYIYVVIFTESSRLEETFQIT